MTVRQWEFIVRDAHGRRRRGTVAWCDRLPSPLRAPLPPAEFAIFLLSAPTDVPPPPASTAICVPDTPNAAPPRLLPSGRLPASAAALTMPAQRMAEYAVGRVVMQARGLIAPADVFPAHGDHPRLDLLARTLLGAAEAEMLAPYTALIRHELHLSPGRDALTALEARLSPLDPRQRPPVRAPGVIRLTKALRRLRAGQRPEGPLDSLAEDLRFLRLFEDADEPLPPAALARLLADVTGEPPPRRAPRPRASDGERSKIARLRAARVRGPREEA